MAGPSWATLAWGGGLGTFLASEPRLAAVTLHRYPLRACTTDPSQPNFPSIANLLAARSSQGVAQAIAPSVRVAHRHRAAFRLDELNSASCSGKRGVSDTFAAALWLADTLFALAAVGVDGVNLHTLPGAAYQPFSFIHDRAGWHGAVAPPVLRSAAVHAGVPARSAAARRSRAPVRCRRGPPSMAAAPCERR